MAPRASKATTQEESIRPVGYVNEQMEHVLIGIHNPTLCSVYPKPDFVQVAITIDNAYILLAGLDAFLKERGVEVH